MNTYIIEIKFLIITSKLLEFKYLSIIAHKYIFESTYSLNPRVNFAPDSHENLRRIRDVA